MEDSIMSVHMDYKNQRQIYISITDFSLKNTLSKKKKPQEITEGIQTGILI